MRYAKDGEPSLLILSLDDDATGDGLKEVFAIPLCPRDGGLLLAIPLGAMSAEALALGLIADDQAFIGPSTKVTTGLIAEDESGMAYRVGVDVEFLLLDVADAMLVGGLIREYDTVTDSTLEIVPFDADHPDGLPESYRAYELAMEWAEQTEGRANFYSARDEPPSPKAKAKVAAAKKAQPKKVTAALLAGRMDFIEAQLKAIADGMAKQSPKATLSAGPVKGPSLMQPAGLNVPPVSGALLERGMPQQGIAKAVQMLGPPPRVRAVGALGAEKHQAQDEPKDISAVAQDPMLQALLNQGTALASLVSHLSGQSDPILDLQMSGTGSQSTSTRGVQRREKMQSDLALGSSQYWVQFQQQLSRRMNPSKAAPKNDQEVQENFTSFLSYLERFGGYKMSKELGMINWILGQAIDSAAQGNFLRTKEHLALCVCAIEQAAQDQSWSTAYLLSLAEDPPTSMFQERTMTMGGSRPFSPLVPGGWGAVALAFLKEVEVLNTKKTEAIVPKAKKAAVPSSGEASESPSPKRRPRYPKRPKAASAAAEGA